MKYTILGFSQERALQFKKTVTDKNGKEKEIKIDCTDLLILRWFVDFYPKMVKIEIEGCQYAWLQYQGILEDLPLLDIKKQALFDRLQKMCEFDILKHKTIKMNGTYSYYGFGEMYSSLIDTKDIQLSKGEYLTKEGISSQLSKGEYLTTKQINSSIKDTSTKDNTSSNIYEENFEKLWKLLKSTQYDRKSAVTKKRKKELFEMGFERVEKAINVYLQTQNPAYYFKRDRFFNEIVDNYLDKEVSDFADVTRKNSYSNAPQLVTINGKEYEYRNGKYYEPKGNGIAVDPYAEDDLPF